MHPRARSSHSGYIFMLPTGSLERAHSDQTVTPLPPPLSFESGARRTRNPINGVSVTLLSQIRLIRIFFIHTHTKEETLGSITASLISHYLALPAREVQTLMKVLTKTSVHDSVFSTVLLTRQSGQRRVKTHTLINTHARAKKGGGLWQIWVDIDVFTCAAGLSWEESVIKAERKESCLQIRKYSSDVKHVWFFLLFFLN